MNTKNTMNRFNECVEDIQDILDEVNEMFELDLEDTELSILGEDFKSHIQNIIDEDTPTIIESIETLMTD